MSNQLPNISKLCVVQPARSISSGCVVSYQETQTWEIGPPHLLLQDLGQTNHIRVLNYDSSRFGDSSPGTTLDRLGGVFTVLTKLLVSKPYICHQMFRPSPQGSPQIQDTSSKESTVCMYVSVEHGPLQGPLKTTPLESWSCVSNLTLAMRYVCEVLPFPHGS